MLVLYVNQNKSHDSVPCNKAKSSVINPYTVEHFAVIDTTGVADP
jgi:hypothetical protein